MEPDSGLDVEHVTDTDAEQTLCIAHAELFS